MEFRRVIFRSLCPVWPGPRAGASCADRQCRRPRPGETVAGTGGGRRPPAGDDLERGQGAAGTAQGLRRIATGPSPERCRRVCLLSLPSVPRLCSVSSLHCRLFSFQLGRFHRILPPFSCWLFRLLPPPPFSSHLSFFPPSFLL